MNIEAFARVRPAEMLSANEVGAGRLLQIRGNTIIAGDDSCQFAEVFGSNTDVTQVHAAAVRPLVEMFLRGFNTCLLVYGESGSGKTHTLTGSSLEDGEPGLVHWIMKDLFDTGPSALQESLGSRAPNTYDVQAEAFESHNELFFDLFQPSEKPLEVEAKEKDGTAPAVKGLSNVAITSDVDGIQLLQTAINQRDASATTFGPVHARSTSAITLRLRQTYEDDPQNNIVSTMTILNVAGSECLCEKSEEVHVKEGPNLNKAVTTLSRVVEQLSAPPDLAVQSDFGNSKLTQLCVDILGGNCKTRVLVTFRAHQSLALPHTLTFAQAVTKIVNYPVFGDLAARGLQRRYRRLIQTASVMSSSPVVEGVDAEVMRLNDLEGQVVHGNLELIKLKDENDRLTKSVAESRAQCTSLMNEKTGLSVSVLNSEEERLKSAKALIDLKIENAQIREDAEAKSFEQTNQQLVVEHDLVETKTRYDALEGSCNEAKSALEEAQQDHRDLMEEYETLKGNHIKTNRGLENERRRVEELGLEVLSLSNARVAVLDGAPGQLDLKASQDKARRMNKEIAEKIASLVQKKRRLEG